jgi:hypothetical protein
MNEGDSSVHDNRSRATSTFFPGRTFFRFDLRIPWVKISLAY